MKTLIRKITLTLIWVIFLQQFSLISPKIEEAKANPGTRANTVQFFVGTFSTDGATGKSLNVENTLPDGGNFTFKLAETGVVIKDAFVDMEIHWNSMAITSAIPNLFMRFDACADPCAPAAWTGSGAASFSATTDFAANSGESEMGYFKMRVSSETQLAAYTGGGSLMRAQFGYCLGTDTSSPFTCTGAPALANRIAYVTARLYVTYTYDDTSTSVTNTVVYPLESTAGGDTGSRKSSQAANCVLGSTCPTFNYKMDAPEFNSRISQWFSLAGSIDASATTDYVTAARVGVNAISSNHIFDETQNSNDAGMIFELSGLAGFAENTSQTLERTGTAYPVFTMGGEVWETYTASSSAGVKTRTIRVPIGEITTAANTTKNSQSVSVSFNETGVTIKKAWVRNVFSVNNSAATNLTIFTKVGANAETSGVYKVIPAQIEVNQNNVINHLIPASDYAVLGSATSSNPVIITVSNQWASARGATSAELFITYTYTGETSGYNTTQILFADQSNTDRNKSSHTAAAGLVDPAIPETDGVTILRAGLLVSYYINDSDNSTPSNVTIGANLTQNPTACSSANSSELNSPSENTASAFLYKNITSVMTASDAQTYTPCYSSNAFTLDSSAGFQVNGMLILTHQHGLIRLEQIHSHWRNDNGSEASATSATGGSEDTLLANLAKGTLKRLRMEISNEGQSASGNVNYRLEYALKSTTCAAIPSGNFTDVGAVGGDWDMADSSNLVDGTDTTNISVAAGCMA